MLFLLYTVDVIGIAHHHEIVLHSYADDMQLFIHTRAVSSIEQIPDMTANIEELARWMSSN